MGQDDGWTRRAALHADALAHERAPAPVYRTGMVVPRSTATAVTLFCGDPSMTRSE